MSLFPAQIGPITEATKAALTADQINLVLVLMFSVVFAMVFQAWKYGGSVDKLRGSMETSFNYARTEQRDSTVSMSKLADSVEAFSVRMVEITEGFARRVNTLGQQMDSGFAATSTVIDGMRQNLEAADKTANLRNEQLMKAVRDAGDKVTGDVSRHVDTALDTLTTTLAGNLDASAAGVREIVGGSLETLLARFDVADGLKDTFTQMVAVWRDVEKALAALRGELAGKDELASVMALLDQILKEIREVKDVQSQSDMEAAAGDPAGAGSAGGLAPAGDGHPSPVGGGQPADPDRDRVLDQHAGGVGSLDAAGGGAASGADSSGGDGQPTSAG